MNHVAKDTKMETAAKAGDKVEICEETAMILRDSGFRPRMMDSVQRIADAAVNRAWDEVAKQFGFRNAIHVNKDGFLLQIDGNAVATLLKQDKEP